MAHSSRTAGIYANASTSEGVSTLVPESKMREAAAAAADAAAASQVLQSQERDRAMPFSNYRRKTAAAAISALPKRSL